MKKYLKMVKLTITCYQLSKNSSTKSFFYSSIANWNLSYPLNLTTLDAKGLSYMLICMYVQWFSRRKCMSMGRQKRAIKQIAIDEHN